MKITLFGFEKEVSEEEHYLAKDFEVTYQCPKCEKTETHVIPRHDFLGQPFGHVTFLCECVETVQRQVVFQPINAEIHSLRKTARNEK
jgi:hypothetical protein